MRLSFFIYFKKHPIAIPQKTPILADTDTLAGTALGRPVANCAALLKPWKSFQECS